MKRLLLGLGAGVLAVALGASAQMRDGTGPHGWCDKDKDGRCDMTGQPVGKRKGRGMAMRQGREGCPRGQQDGCCRRGPGNQAQPNPKPAPEPKK